MTKEKISNYQYLSDLNLGASGIFSPIDHMIFTFFMTPQDEKEKILDFLKGWGYNADKANKKYDTYIEKLSNEGWLNKNTPILFTDPIKSLYFTITSNCNLNCPYCYQGKLKEKCYVSVENAKLALDGLIKVNPNSKIIVTGGETFMHPDIFEILDLIEFAGFSFSILTNGTLINEKKALKLASYKQLSSIQVSLDGMEKKTNSITRGNSYEATIQGIDSLSRNNLPFSLAPTIHEDNSKEIKDIAKFAFKKGGNITPNNLIVFPESKENNLSLSNKTLSKVLKEVDSVLFSKKEYSSHIQVNTQKRKASTLCGIAYETLDLNWNGDVYPCNLLRKDEFILGNLFQESWSEILKKGLIFRKKLHCSNIEKCSTCDIMPICNGGCRASAFYKYGTFQKEDPLCDLRYKNIKGEIIDECTKLSRNENQCKAPLIKHEPLDQVKTPEHVIEQKQHFSN